MKDDRDYQVNPQTEEELKKAREIILPDRDHDYKATATAPDVRTDEDINPFPIRGIEMGSLERDRILNENFRNKQRYKEVREQIFNDSQSRISTKATQPDKGRDYTELYDKLKKTRITGISLQEFTNIIEHHSITLGTNRGTWEGIPADAHRFTTAAGLTVKEFNNCFNLKKRKLRSNDEDKHSKETDFTKSLSRLLSK